MQIILYSTDGCHLCEQAIGMYYYAKQQQLFTVDVELAITDIVEDSLLVEQYGESIPVFFCPATSGKLYWPLDIGDLVSWINSLEG